MPLVRPARLLVVCPLVASLLAAYSGTIPAVAQDRTPQFRAFWADAFHTGFKSTSQISSLISRAVSGRYNAIVVEVLAYQDTAGGGHGAYWNSSIVPKATDISGGIDPLAVLVSNAHASGLEVHAWLVPYRVCTAWPPAGNPLLASHPEWLMVPYADMGGGPATISSKYVLDPGSPDAQEYILSIVRELVTNYAIDGINYDYIRYEQQNAGYPADANYENSSLARFQRLTGYVGVPWYTEAGWSDFRRQTINELVRRTRAEMANITTNPRQPLRFTCDLICFGNAPTNFESSSAYTLHSNWRYWLERGWLDAGVIMNYKREWDSAEAQWYRNWVNAAIGWRYARHLYAGQANYLNPKAMSITQLAYCYSAGADGTCNYSYVGTADENMDGDWETDWNWYSYVASQLFTTVVTPPSMPWRHAATATEGTLWGRATDPSTGDPIDGATISAGGQSFETDGNGYYVITLLPAAPGGTLYDVAASENGCTPQSADDVLILPGGLTRLDFDLCISQPPTGDMNEDGQINFADYPFFVFCLKGPGIGYTSGHFCLQGDVDDDGDVDLPDLAAFQRSFSP